MIILESALFCLVIKDNIDQTLYAQIVLYVNQKIIVKSVIMLILAISVNYHIVYTIKNVLIQINLYVDKVHSCKRLPHKE